MIYFIKGKLIDIHTGFVILESNSIGYKIFTIPKSDYALNTEITLHTYLHVADGILDLYGFSSIQERDLFVLLLSVSKVGPKAALSIISHLPVSNLCIAIIEEDVNKLSQVKGIGQKGAQRIVMELKYKIKNKFSDLYSISSQNSEISTNGNIRFNSKFLDCVDTLEALGCNKNQAEKLVTAVYQPDLDTQEIIKLALKNKK